MRRRAPSSWPRVRRPQAGDRRPPQGATKPTTAFGTWSARRAQEYIDFARKSGRKPILVVAGRPYHMDPEINHGINDLITSFGFVLVTEDAVFQHMGKEPRHVLNQWTYHARMYNAARYVCTQPDMALHPAGRPSAAAWTPSPTDELRSILEERRRAVHPAQDRRHLQPWRGQDPHPKPDRRPGRQRRPGQETRTGRRGRKWLS